MASITWVGGTSTSWNEGTNWSGGFAPIIGDDAEVTKAAPLANEPILDVTTTTASLNSLTIDGSAELTVAGGTLAVSGDVSLAGGAVLGGFGTLSVSGQYKAVGGGEIKASGGTLSVSGSVVGGIAMTIDTGSASDLKILGSAIAGQAIAISSANQTLEVGASGTLTIGDVESITNGTIKLDGGKLEDDAGITLGTGSTLIGAGEVISGTNGSGGNGLLSGPGTVEANGGQLELKRDTAASAGLQFEVSNDVTSILQLDGAVGDGNTFTFMGPTGQLAFDNQDINAPGISANIVGLNVGTSNSIPTNLIDFRAHIVSLNGGNTFAGPSGTIDLSDGSVLALSGITGPVGQWFADTTSPGGVGTEIFLSTVAPLIGISLTSGGTVTTKASDIITGETDGVKISGSSGTVTNAGTITGISGNGVYLNSGGKVTNSGCRHGNKRRQHHGHVRQQPRCLSKVGRHGHEQWRRVDHIGRCLRRGNSGCFGHGGQRRHHHRHLRERRRRYPWLGRHGHE